MHFLVRSCKRDRYMYMYMYMYMLHVLGAS